MKNIYKLKVQLLIINIFIFSMGYIYAFSLDDALKTPSSSVLKTGDNIIPGIDPNDYISFAPYWWECPDPDSNHFYYRKDGVRNKELIKLGDAKKFQSMVQSVVLLSRNYNKNDSETKKYVVKAGELLKAWFIEPETKMNPNLNNAQMINGPHNDKKNSTSCIPGKNIKSKGGTQSGILEFRYIISLLTVMPIITEAGVFTQDEKYQLQLWLKQYYQWLTMSKLGRELGREKSSISNNHATWYDAQVISLAIYLGKIDEAKTRLYKVRDKIDQQFSVEGQQPQELSRSNALTYSLFNLQAFFILAYYGEKLNIDLWGYKGKNGQSILKAYDFIKQFKGQCESEQQCKFGKNNEYNQLDTVKTTYWQVLDPTNRQEIIYNITN